MAHQVVTAKVREEVGKNRSASLRSEGLVPATIYGDQKDPISVSVNPRDLIPVYRGPLGKNTVISLQVENNGQTSTEEVISYKIDRDPISLEIKHVDFLRVTDKPVRAEVALKLTGSAPGVKLGGMMMQHISRVQ
ncbi:50S ribosomal protein L25, partial [bacterium]|nr:50S ribosomal protein L25 [bacterium]